LDDEVPYYRRSRLLFCSSFGFISTDGMRYCIFFIFNKIRKYHPIRQQVVVLECN
jgi:hypothetical protein